MSALYDTNPTIAFMVDGEKGTDTYDGSNSETLAVPSRGRYPNTRNS